MKRRKFIKGLTLSAIAIYSPVSILNTSLNNTYHIVQIGYPTSPFLNDYLLAHPEVDLTIIDDEKEDRFDKSISYYFYYKDLYGIADCDKIPLNENKELTKIIEKVFIENQKYIITTTTTKTNLKICKAMIQVLIENMVEFCFLGTTMPFSPLTEEIVKNAFSEYSDNPKIEIFETTKYFRELMFKHEGIKITPAFEYLDKELTFTIKQLMFL